MIKLVSCFRRRRDLPAEQFAVYWNDEHGPLVSRLPGLRRLVQSHAVTEGKGEGRRDYDGMCELWFDNVEALEAARRSEIWAATREDEARFLEPGSESAFVTAEHEVPIPSTTSGWPRMVVLGLIENEAGEVLLCRMPPPRPFAGQWALPGGGVEPGENVEEAMRREASEELGLQLTGLVPAAFVEGRHEKKLPDGGRIQRHMIFLLFRARAVGTTVRLNPEFDQCAWIAPARLSEYAVSPATRTALTRLGLMKA
jgi:nucleoside triphosphatase